VKDTEGKKKIQRRKDRGEKTEEKRQRGRDRAEEIEGR
jgi:hypothetical protein